MLHLFWENLTRQPRRLPSVSPTEDGFSKAWEAGRKWMEQKKWPEAVAELDKALPSVPSDKPEVEAELHYLKGYALEQTHQWELAMPEYLFCRSVEQRHALSKYKAFAAFRLGHVLMQLGRFKEAEDSLKQCVAEAQHYSLHRLHLNGLRALSALYQFTHDHAKAEAVVLRSLRLAQGLEDEFDEALILDQRGDIELALGRYDDALHSYEASLDMLRKLGHVRGQLMVEQDIARLYQACGELEKALTWLNVCLQEEDRAENAANCAQIRYELACLHIGSGAFREAALLLQDSMALFRKVQDKVSIDMVGRTLMGLGVMMQREATSSQMTFRDIERGAKSREEDK